jgi:UDP-2,4-diacetamido-2,4,6-trideoxy-beta-L-altropyranose hydrolase
MNVLFRCDASLAIGSGHVMRCLTLANALRKEGARCRFVCREYPGNLINKICAADFPVVGLPVEGGLIPSPERSMGSPKHAAWLGADWQTDAAQTFEAFPDENFDWLVVDHYGIESRWENTFRGSCENILVIDDLADRKHDCDILLDQNLVAEMDKRYAGLVPEDCTKLLGPKYALLQPEYAELREKAKPREGPIKRILVYFGGADQDNLTGTTVEAILSVGYLNLFADVVINPESPYAESVRHLVKNKQNFRLYENVPSLAFLMLEADLCIGASGATTWERCCLGLPALVVTLAENQLQVAMKLHAKGAIKWIGDINSLNKNSLIEKIENALVSISLKDMSKTSYNITEGNGLDFLLNAMHFNGPENIVLMGQ